MNMAEMVIECYPDDLNWDEMNDVEDIISQVVTDPESKDGCAVRAYLVELIICCHDSESLYSYERLQGSAYSFCDGWDKAIALTKGGE